MITEDHQEFQKAVPYGSPMYVWDDFLQTYVLLVWEIYLDHAILILSIHSTTVSLFTTEVVFELGLDSIKEPNPN